MTKNMGIHLRIASLATLPAILIGTLAGVYIITGGRQQFKSSFVEQGHIIARLLVTPVKQVEHSGRLHLTQSLLQERAIQAIILTNRQGKILETVGKPSVQLLRAAQITGENAIIGDNGVAIFSIPLQPSATGKSAAQGWVEISTVPCRRHFLNFIRDGILSILAGILLSIAFGRWLSQRFVLLPRRNGKSIKNRLRDGTTAEEHPPSQSSVAQTLHEPTGQTQPRCLAILHHEIRTPLNGLIGFVELLGQTTLSSQQRHHLDAIRASAQILHTVIDDMAESLPLNAESTSIVHLPMNLSQVMDETVARHRPEAARKQLTLTLHCDQAIPSQIIGAPVRISQVLSNLIGNAVKFTTRGNIEVSAALTGQSDALMQIVLTVSDTGPGMDAATQDRVRSPSIDIATTTIAQAGRREQLGLIISKNLTMRMGGIMGVDSIPGKGCRVYFTLPLQSVPPLPHPRHTAISVDTPSVPDEETPHALIVDDDPINRLLAKTLLTELQIPCDEVASGEQALVACQLRYYALILMDIQLPQADGVTTTARIRAAQTGRPSTAIIAVTAENDEQARTRYLTAGFDDILIKPLNRRGFQAVIRQQWCYTPTAAFNGQMDDTGTSVAADITAKMRHMLVAELPSQQEAIWTALREENRGRLHCLAHRLHGAAHYCGTPVLAQAAKALASAARQNMAPSQLATLVETLDSAMNILLLPPLVTRDDGRDQR